LIVVLGFATDVLGDVRELVAPSSGRSRGRRLTSVSRWLNS